jgi:hypothetical protein
MSGQILVIWFRSIVVQRQMSKDTFDEMMMMFAFY